MSIIAAGLTFMAIGLIFISFWFACDQGEHRGTNQKKVIRAPLERNLILASGLVQFCLGAVLVALGVFEFSPSSVEPTIFRAIGRQAQMVLRIFTIPSIVIGLNLCIRRERVFKDFERFDCHKPEDESKARVLVLLVGIALIAGSVAVLILV